MTDDDPALTAWRSIKEQTGLLGSHLDPEGRAWLFGMNRYSVRIEGEMIDVTVGSRRAPAAAPEMALGEWGLEEVSAVVATILDAEAGTAGQVAEAVGA